MISAAFFDVDETLIQCKSMFAFLKFFLEKTGLKLQSKTYTDIMSDIDRKVQSGANRSEINTYYYQLYKSVSQNQVRHYAKEFFSENKSNLFKNVTLALLQKHVANNVKVVFVSGAMPDILLPIADYLGVNEFICSLPEVVNGYYTGSLVQQAIGANKAQLMENYASENGIDLKQLLLEALLK